MGTTPPRSRDVTPALARRPAVAASVAFIAGIALPANAPYRPAQWMTCVGVAVLGAMLSFRRPLLSTALVATALLLAGVTGAQLYAFAYPRDHVSAFAADQPRLAQLELKIDRPRRVLTAPFAPRRPLPPKQVVTATVTRVKTWDGWEPASGEILVQISEPHPRLAAGQRVRVLGMLQRPGPAMNPGQFDWAAYYRDQRILASVQVPHAGNIDILEARGPDALTSLREQVRRLLAAGFSSSRLLDHALLRALLLGDSDPELRDVQEQFRRTGTSHHLSISGMHVAVLGGFVYLLCRLLRVPPRATAWTMLTFVIVYGFAALPSPPVVRSVLLCAAFAVGLVSRKSLDAVQLLALS